MYIHMAILVRLSSPIKVSTIFENFLSLLVVSPSSSKRGLISSKHVTLLRLLSTSGDEELWELVSASTIDFLQYMFTYFQLIILAKNVVQIQKRGILVSIGFQLQKKKFDYVQIVCLFLHFWSLKKLSRSFLQ